MIVKNQTPRFNATKKRYIVLIALAGSILWYSPEFAVYTIKSSEVNSSVYYYLQTTEFGASQYYNYYFYITTVTLIIISIPVYLVLILLIIKNYKIYTERRRSMISESVRNENRLTKFVIISGFATIAKVILYVTALCLRRLSIFKKYYFYLFSIIIRFTSVYIYYDRNCWNVLKKLFKFNK